MPPQTPYLSKLYSILLGTLLATIPGLAWGTELFPVEKELVEKTNAQRKEHGLPPLEIDEELMASARAHTQWMIKNRSLTHTQKGVGENIAMGQPTSREAMQDWMRSPGHRANILHRGYKKIGVAAFQTKNGAIYWCQQFLK